MTREPRSSYGTALPPAVYLHGYPVTRPRQSSLQLILSDIRSDRRDSPGPRGPLRTHGVPVGLDRSKGTPTSCRARYRRQYERTGFDTRTTNEGTDNQQVKFLEDQPPFIRFGLPVPLVQRSLAMFGNTVTTHASIE